MPSRLLMQPRCLPHAPARAPCAPSHAARSRPPICVRLAGGEPHPWRQRPRGRVGAAGAGQAAAPGCLRTHITPPLLPSCVPVQPCPTPLMLTNSTNFHRQGTLPLTAHMLTVSTHFYQQHTHCNATQVLLLGITGMALALLPPVGINIYPPGVVSHVCTSQRPCQLQRRQSPAGRIACNMLQGVTNITPMTRTHTHTCFHPPCPLPLAARLWVQPVLQPGVRPAGRPHAAGGHRHPHIQRRGRCRRLRRCLLAAGGGGRVCACIPCGAGEGGGEGLCTCWGC